MSETDFRPNWASAPGSTIADILHERRLSKTEFAKRIEVESDQLEDLLDGRSAITISTARLLEQVLGGSVEFWMARDLQYRQDIGRLNEKDDEWVRELPVDEMMAFGWIPRVTGLAERISACLRFFDVGSARAWHAKYANVQQMVAFKRSRTFESRPAAVAAWLRQGELEAENIDCRHWDAEAFRASLTAVRSLTLQKHPAHFVPELRRICAATGVAVAIVRAPRGCPVAGATKFLSRDKALLLLSFRYLTDDHFWFALFHEAGHLLLHGQDRLFLDGRATPSTAEEDQADEFAFNVLIPAQVRPGLMALRSNTRDVIRFALKIGISPGIVVGQLQHLGIVPRNYLNRLRRHYRWEE